MLHHHHSTSCKETVINLICLLGAVILFLGCAGPMAATPSAPRDIPRDGYRSEDYIVSRLTAPQTPSALAQQYLGDQKRAWVIEAANPGIAFQQNDVIVIPLKDRNRGGLKSDGYQMVPILCYHRFKTTCKSSLCMPADNFEHQMRYLKENGYHTISFEELNGFLEYRRAIPPRSVIISIDDGYRSVYTIAYPILKKYGFTATLFVYTDFVGASRNALTWKQLREMRDAGFEVGGHSVSHSDLTRQKETESKADFAARVEWELQKSKEIIDKKMGQNTVFLAFPYGRYDQRVLEVSQRLGYKVAASVKRGGNPFFADPLALKRDQVLKRDMATFVSRLKHFQKLSLE